MKKPNFLVKLANEGKLQVIEPNEDVKTAYLQKSAKSLSSAKALLEIGNLEDSVALAYYAMYHSLLALLFRAGIKCENHFCSILAVENLLGEESVKTINEHKLKRIDAQYYMKVVSEEKIKEMLRFAKVLVSEFDNLVSTLSEKEVDSYRKKLQGLLR